MNNEDLKKKIVEVISQKQTYGIKEDFKTEDLGHGGWQAWTETTKVNNAEVADALIAAGIGDVTEWKEKAKKHRVQVLPDGTIKQLYSDEEVEDIARQRDEYKHRAEVAERAFDLILKREKDLRCIHSFTDCDKNCESCWEEYFSRQKQGYFEQAEKELAEEGEDGIKTD